MLLGSDSTVEITKNKMLFNHALKGSSGPSKLHKSYIRNSLCPDYLLLAINSSSV